MNDDKKILRFDLSPQDLKVKKLLGKEFLELEIWAISDIDPNPNKTHFTKASLENSKDSFYNKPILGAFKYNDFAGHEGKIVRDPFLNQEYWDNTNGEQILGFVPHNSNVEIVEKKNLNWVKLEAVIWVQYNYRQVKKLLKSSKTTHVSVEITVLDSYVREDDIEVINKFILNGITILGDLMSPGIPDAHLTILDKMEEVVFSERVANLQFAYKSLEEKQKSVFTEEESVSHNLVNESNNKEGGVRDLTYEQKRTVLESFLAEYVREHEGEDKNVEFWVADLSENVVYFRYNGAFYSANYEITKEEEQPTKGFINMDEKVTVIRSWEVFSESKLTKNPEDVISHKPSEKFGEDEEPKEPEDEEPEEPEDEEPEGPENFEQHPDTDPNTVNLSDDDPNKEPDDSNGKQGEGDDEGSTATINQEPVNQEPVNQEPVNQEPVNQEPTKEMSAVIEEKEKEYEKLEGLYNELKEKYDAVFSECEGFKAEKFKADCLAMYNKACMAIDEEDELSDDDSTDLASKKQLKEELYKECMCGTFKSDAEAYSYSEDMVAKVVYKKKKKNKETDKSNKKEFSLPLGNLFNNNSVKTSFDILKEFNNK